VNHARWTRLVLACTALGGAAAAQDAPATAPATRADKTYFYLRAYPDQLLKFDPASDQVVATLQNKHGICHGNTLSHDKRQLFDITGQRTYVEVVDLATMQVVDEHLFREDNFLIRVDDVEEQPGGARWFVKTDRVENKLDHYVVQEPQWLDYDVLEKKVLKRDKELPKPLRRGARISPDGGHWLVVSKDLRMLEPATLDELGLIELSKPLYPGLGAISLRGDDLFDEKQPDAGRYLYTMRDPVNAKRTLFGVVDLDYKNFKVSNLRELGFAPPVRNWQVTQDQHFAIGVKRGGNEDEQADGADLEEVLYTFDLTTGKKVRETRVKLRNGLSLRALSPDGSKIYFGGRGHELVVYSAEHEYLKTVQTPGELDGWVIQVRP
jgi:hypothetical protein